MGAARRVAALGRRMSRLLRRMEPALVVCTAVWGATNDQVSLVLYLSTVLTGRLSGCWFYRAQGVAMTDVTDQVSFQNPDDEALPLTRCVCGAAFRPWEQIVSIYDKNPWECPSCGAKLVFGNAVRVYQVS